jgi:hypothetical protein
MNDLKVKFTAYVALDMVDKKHDVCVQVGEVDERHYYVIEHTPEALEQWLELNLTFSLLTLNPAKSTPVE